MRAAEGVGVLSPPAHGATRIPLGQLPSRLQELAWADAVDQRMPKY
jgi:hypothetical protein